MMIPDFYKLSWQFQQDFFGYIQHELLSLNVPTVFQESQSISFPYVILSLKTLQEFFRGKAWFIMEISLLHTQYSVELERSIITRLYPMTIDPVILTHFQDIPLGSTITYLNKPTRSYKLGKQYHSTLWTFSIMSRWSTKDY
ncbi:hypothetical protein [Holospora curviuscula]|uniref:Uncharacterized protein n=1 Tax=Holospora curviuscula TaxID=1082868 RepID=A0A2S5R7A7_9PROT|nr:hypothetical protein [Holospora curviuscula]PPE03183.1 hypothetical protein HCUR_01383 [Holospora curviuscula]